MFVVLNITFLSLQNDDLLMLVLLTFLIGAVLIFLFWFYKIRSKVNIPVNPGGHWLLGHLGCFMSIKDPDNFEPKFFELTDPKYGDVGHLKFLHVTNLTLNTAAVAENLLKSNVNINKTWQYDLFADWMKGSVLILPGAKWQRRRKLLTPAFHFNILESFIEVMRHSSIRLSEKLLAMAQEGPVEVLVTPLLNVTTFNTLVETSFGYDSDAFEQEHEVFTAFSKILVTFVERPQNVLYYFDTIYNQTKSGKQAKKYLAIINDFLRELIKTRRQAKADGTVKLHKGKFSFLDHMINIQDENPEEMPEEYMLGECNTIMLAGHGTVTGTVNFALYFLCKHPDIQQKIFDEVTEAVGEGSIDDVKPQNLLYLTQVIRETLRLQPPAPNFARKLSEPMMAGKYLIPAGTNVDVMIWHIHRDPKVWSDPERFDPDRFTAENMKTRSPYAFIPFSAGPRNCLGFRFAMMEMRMLISYIIYNFKVTTEQTMGVDLIRHIEGISVVPGPNLKIKFEKRH